MYQMCIMHRKTFRVNQLDWTPRGALPPDPRYRLALHALAGRIEAQVAWRDH